MLNARNLKLSFGSRVILNDVSITLLPRDRVAMVGQNGVGKSTLIKLLAGDQPDSGMVEMNKQITIGYLKQVPDLDGELSVVETVRQGLQGHFQKIEEHQRLCGDLAALLPGRERDKLIHKIDELAHVIERSGGFDVDYWVERVLTRLGIKARLQKINTLSGGEKRRVDLARILLSQPDVYLLDEPTNHLDVSAIQFLVDIFTKSTSALLFISHDVRFIDDLATRIVELDKGKLYTHEPPFANYLENKVIRNLIDERSLHRRERLIVGELAWLRAGTPARTTKQNARIDRAYELMDTVAKDSQEQREKRLEIEAAKTLRLGGTIIELDHVGARFGDRVLFKDFSLKVTKGQRIGIVGPNGSGKTTLLSMLSKKIAPSSGQIVFGKNSEVVQFDQQREALDQNLTLKETLADHGDYVHISGRNIHIARYLENYLFDSQDANRRISTLSGGEQNRLMLAKLLRHSANILLLDEPTNDLDVTSLAVLEEVLLDYDGVVFVVSHDRNFLDRICNAIIAFEPTGHGESRLVTYAGNWSDYVHLSAKAESAEERQEQAVVAKAIKPPEKIKAKTRRSFKEEREFQEIEGIIEALEKERTSLHADLSDSEVFRKPEVAAEKSNRLDQVEQEIERLYARWQELADIGG